MNEENVFFGSLSLPVSSDFPPGTTSTVDYRLEYIRSTLRAVADEHNTLEFPGNHIASTLGRCLREGFVTCSARRGAEKCGQLQISVFGNSDGLVKMRKIVSNTGFCSAMLDLAPLLFNKNPDNPDQYSLATDNTVDFKYTKIIDDLLRVCLPSQYPCSERDLILQPAGIIPTLLPFQKRALSWLLSREGAISKYEPSSSTQYAIPLFCRKVTTNLGNSVYFNSITGEISSAQNVRSLKWDNSDLVSGGILADEMGLGKTVEVLALICAHKLTLSTNSNTAAGFKNAGTTLIITPSSILSQWISEIENHAPSLKIWWYKGRHRGDNTDSNELAKYDIVLTTYDVLQKEIHLAKGDNTRSRRYNRVYERPKSPLIDLKWWRVCLDEAQMVENPTSQTSEMARIIPRTHAWAITGTPVAKSGIQDLRGLCMFLEFEPLASSGASFSRLMLPENYDVMLNCFSQIMHRNSKANVEHELQLPKQTQFVIELEFSAIERSYYNSLYEACIDDLKKIDDACSTESKKRGKLIEESKTKMRSWLLQLRQACCHPQVGEHNRNLLGRKIGTIEEVLDVMIKQSESAVVSAERTLIGLRIDKAHLFEFQKEYIKAINIYQSVLVDVVGRIQMTDAQLKILIAKRSVEPNPDPDEVKDEEDKDKKENETNRADLQSILSNILGNFKELQHQIIFFIACCYNSLKEEETEAEYYKRAETLRREILGDYEAIVEKYRALMFNNPNPSTSLNSAIMKLRKWRRSDACNVPIIGIVVRPVLENIRHLLANLNSQWDSGVTVWRSRILSLINTNLENVESADGEPAASRLETVGLSATKITDLTQPSGEEYSHGVEIQTELDVLLDNYADLLAERKEMLNGILLIVPKSVDIEASKIERECRKLRKMFCLKKGDANLVGLLKELKYIADDLDTPDVEKQIGMSTIAAINAGVELQLEVLAELNKELMKLRRLANARIEFYKHLQQISDGLVQPDKPDDIDQSLLSAQSSIQKAEVALALQISRQKYLHSLIPKPDKSNHATEKEEATEENECLVCKAPFDIGFITECGHFYCDYCMKMWVAKRRKCALCNAPLPDLNTQLTRVAPMKQTTSPCSDWHVINFTDSLLEKEYLPDSAKDKIASLKLESTSSLGTKTDFILRHLLYIKKNDPDAKSLIFSQWEQVLNVIATGCEINDINYVKLEVGRGKDSIKRFREDSSIKVFMLNARSQSSGLTLINATHVFLFEPVVNPGLEAQAINRVHRIGQTKETFVYRYFIKDTIEQRVYSLQSRHAGSQSITAKTEASTMGGGEFVIDSDVKWCLLGDRETSMEVDELPQNDEELECNAGNEDQDVGLLPENAEFDHNVLDMQFDATEVAGNGIKRSVPVGAGRAGKRRMNGVHNGLRTR